MLGIKGRVLLYVVALSIFLALFIDAAYAVKVPYPAIPNEKTTPGSVCTVDHQDFKEYRYQENIPYCERNVSSSFKARIYKKYRVPSHCKSNYTIDHLIPLSVGGDNSEENLWPEHKAIKKIRINLENEIYWSLKNGEITQDEAVSTIIIEKLNPPLEDIEDFKDCK